MVEPVASERRRGLWSVSSLIVAVMAVGALVLCGGSSYLVNKYTRTLDPNYVSQQEALSQEEALRKAGPAEEDAERVEAAIERAANTVVAHYPALSWRWGEQPGDPALCDSYSTFRKQGQVEPVQIMLRHIVFNSELVGQARERMLAALEAEAKELGIGRKESFVDSYGRSWTRFAQAPGSSQLSLISGKAKTGVPGGPAPGEDAPAALEGRSACLFPQRYFTEHPAPSPSR